MSEHAKAILICPEHRPAGKAFHQMKPLVLMPLLGRSLIEHHVAALAAKGVKEVTVLASDRPEMIREALDGGVAWGLAIEVVSTRCEFNVEDAEQQYAGRAKCLVQVIDGLPDDPSPVWPSYVEVFARLCQLMSLPAYAESLTMKETAPGVWISTRARVDEGAIINAPVWIGAHARISKGATIGPRTIVEGHAFIDEHVTLSESWVGPATYIGPAMDIGSSFVWGKVITNWGDGAALEIEDEFVLNDLDRVVRPMIRIGWAERLAALWLLVFTAPLAGVAMMAAWLRKQTVLVERRIILPPVPKVTASAQTRPLLEIHCSRPLLRRWPELWQVVRGAMGLVGNRPLPLKVATALRGEMGQMWFAVPAGVFSLADCEGDDPELMPFALAHAAYFAAHRTVRLRLHILLRCLRRLLQTVPDPALLSSHETQHD